MHSSADEMELYAQANKKFRQVFNRQEHMKTFKTYDRLEIGQENWGVDSSTHALRAEATWLPFIKLKCERDPHQEQKLVQLRTRNNVDELLRVQSMFIQITDCERVQDALREHAVLVRDPMSVQPVSVTSNRTSYHTGAIWKRIYTNPQLYEKSRDDGMLMEEFDDKDADNVNLASRSRSPSARKRRDSYDYADAVQLLGLDDGMQDSNDPTSIQGAYLSFLQLRHLRIRDLQRTSQSVLNYFRSLERTLTINDGGLSLESSKAKKVSGQNHRKSVVDGGLGGGGSLGSHQYIHNTPRDFKLEESEFIEFDEIDNHDDFYTIDEGRVHVQDQRGYYIMYDCALNDFKELEKDLLLIATHFIEKDKDLRSASGIFRSDSARRKQQTHGAGDFDIPSYSHQEVDRFAVLMDLWSHHSAYLECKRELIDCFMEAYNHVFDRDEKRALAQALVNIMYRRPRFDYSADYFVRNYRLECNILRKQAALMKSILDNHIDEQREYVQKVCREGDKDFGLPHKVIPKQSISVNLSRPALRNVYMLEFHPTLAMAANLPDALNHTFWELHHAHKPACVTDELVLEKNIMDAALKSWDEMEIAGSSYTLQVQKDLFSDVFVEDPLFVCEIAQTMVLNQDSQGANRSQKEKQLFMVNTLGRVLDGVTLRHRLIDAAWESELLSKVYRQQAQEMGFSESHLFLRFVQFEFAAHKEEAGRPPPVFITSVLDDDTSVDKYVPNHLYLGVQELDESHVGRFSFRGREGVLQVLKPSSLASFRVILMCQLVHKNMLVSAIQQFDGCHNMKAPKSGKSGRPGTPTETRSEKSSTTAMTGASSGTGMTVLGGKLHTSAPAKYVRPPEAFLSLQMEKTPTRDLMLNDFVNKKNSMGTILRNPDEMEKLKRKLISEFCWRFQMRINQYSLRSQIIAYYNSLLKLLDSFPNIRDTYFMLGEPNEKKTDDDSLKGLQSDPREFQRRPRRVLTQDGKFVLNVWFIPHQTELLIMYKSMTDDDCAAALTTHLQLVSSLHDILQYLCAHAKLGSGHARMGSKKMEFVSADWGGNEGIGADLREIQKQLDALETKIDPEQVCQFLTLRRDVMFLEFDVAVRHSVRDTFLATGNVPAYKAVTECMHFALHYLSNAQKPGVNAAYLNVPEPLEARQAAAQVLFPWRSYINQNGPHPGSFWKFYLIEHYMQLCLAGLKDVDRHVANGEILSVSLLMEDVLTTGIQERVMKHALRETEGSEDADTDGDITRPSSRLSQTSKSSYSRPASSMSLLTKRQGSRKGSVARKILSRNDNPIEAYRLMRTFLLLTKRVERCKWEWGLDKLQVEAINSTKQYKHFCIEFKKEVLYPVLSSVARRFGQGDMYEGMINNAEPLVIPKGASEFEVRIRLLLRVLESLECRMIHEVRRKLSKELNLSLSERAREESALPTDLWKKPSMKESYTINKPYIAEEFIDSLMSEMKENGEEYTLTKSHLNTCLAQLARDVMARERHNYDSYSMYYENLLRVHHQQLYQREQEVKQLKDQLDLARMNVQVEVQCGLADQNQDLLLEITALRAKIAEMREMSLTQEHEIRERIKDEYHQLVENLFSSTYKLRKRYDLFREELHDDVFAKITEARGEAVRAITKLKQRNNMITESEESMRSVDHANKVREIQHENHQLNQLVSKMKTVSHWKQNFQRGIYARSVSDLRRESEKSKKQYLEVKMLAEEEMILLRQQLVAVRNALRDSEKECIEIRSQLEIEMREKKEKQHEAAQKAHSQKQLEAAKKQNIEKLLEDLEDKDWRLKQLAEEQEKTKRLNLLISEKNKKDTSSVKKLLSHERNLKLDAFQRVDELQTQVYDIECGVLSRPQTAMTVVPTTAPSRAKSRISSASAKKSRNASATPSSGGVWPPPVTWPHRSVTPAGDLYYSVNVNVNPVPDKKIQRPKTAIFGTRL